MTYFNAMSPEKNIQRNALFSGMEWPPASLMALGSVTKSSNQVLRKNNDDSIEGVRYVVAAEPSTLRPTRAWTINIEHWTCKSLATITARDVLFIRIINSIHNDQNNYEDVVKDISVHNQKMQGNNQNAFNAVMAAVVLISKIDAARLPDIEKTLSIYNLR